MKAIWTILVLVFALSAGGQSAYMQMVLKAHNAADARARPGVTTGGSGVSQTNISYTAVTNLSSYSVTDAQIASTIARDSEVVSATNGLYSAVEPTIAAGTSGQYWRGDKTWQTLPSASQTNIALTGVTNAGNIGYSNAIDFHTNGSVVVVPHQRIFPPSPQLVTGGTFALISNTGYFCYIGKVEKTTTFARVRFQVTTAGNAAATNEVALYSTPEAPNSTAQTLTRLAGSGVQTSTGSTGVKSNVTSFAVSIPQGTHLWAGIRSASLTTQPTCVGLSYDMLGGAIFTKATVNALTNVANATITSPTIPAFSTATVAPSLRVTLD